MAPMSGSPDELPSSAWFVELEPIRNDPEPDLVMKLKSGSESNGLPTAAALDACALTAVSAGSDLMAAAGSSGGGATSRAAACEKSNFVCSPPSSAIFLFRSSSCAWRSLSRVLSSWLSRRPEPGPSERQCPPWRHTRRPTERRAGSRPWPPHPGPPPAQSR
jgi:hypothetical protein